MHIRILHTNDIHSHFETYPKLATFLKDSDKNVPSVLVDIGDNMDRFHSITEATNGRANTALLNYLQYDFATIGNNEGITLAYQELTELYQEAEFSVLVANLFEQNGNYPEWIKPYAYKEIEGLKVCFIGVTVFYQKFYQLLGWKLEEPFQVLEEILPEIVKEADAVVVLSHLGITDDEEMARRFPAIDVILGGHTHHVLPEGKWIGNTLLCGAGKYGEYIGQVDLSFNQEKKILQKSASLHSLRPIKACPSLQSKIEEIQHEASAVLRNNVAIINRPLKVSWFEDSPFPDLLAEALKEWCDADIGMVNAGVLLESIEAGEVTKEDLHRICPHPINPCRVSLTGEELKEVIQQAVQPEMEKLRIKGIGFRGKVMGKMAFSGLGLETEVHSDGSVQVVTVFVNGRDILPHEIISIGTIDMFTFGGMYPSIMRAKDKKFYMPELLRDVLAGKIARL
ncbi:bifunctional metallophosphatase/5'-nucleotidase [Sutcliffiella halmapala]|uniref:bifunctional metallophosphatase/5'-nucleotidase n=1 Tax=Sutcliffiella halmapala TaxID=79882 RepID=UPI000995C6A4|nr:bifunctional UDP-sugar hydrolase/5'-nucleotidase [Sutcliffiella halmapala]